ncbi:hypothetical protein F5878DRAFT_642342 [Lentinula raphanica]|uniref:Zn(2)-C6 fungal-type domain-containing protein n=1 Tax=Lentinula raphanica TaxID=153919 RepID=A0AA38P7X9_9AGAR|nr:hypothetical protein F5878DRAFT_642342 [Lentinula raphanica]
MVDINTTTKRLKKLPACDFCKAKRVLCHPQADAPCPRCVEKGLICKTTPVVRRKRRTKAQIEEARQAEDEASGSQSTSYGMHSLEIRRERSSMQTLDTRIFVNLGCQSLDIPPSLVRELFEDFQLLPQRYYPLLPYNDLEASLQKHSWDLHALAPQDRVLAQCIIAIGARITTSSHFVDLDDADIVQLPYFEPLKTQSLDCRHFGQRREQFCQQLKGEAGWLAQCEGVMYNISITNAVSLGFLEFLEYRLMTRIGASGKGANVYSAAYIHHLQIDLNTISTINDEYLLCGEDPTTLEQILSVLSPDSVVATPIFNVMRPMCFHLIHLARDISETLAGAYARRHPLNETKITHHLRTLDLVHSAISCGLGQMQRLRSTADEEFFQKMRYCAYPLMHGWSSLVLLVFEELKGRRGHIRLTEVDLAMGTSSLDSLYSQARLMTSQAALELAESLQEVPGLSRLTHMNYGDLKRWPKFLLEDATDLNAAQRVWALERFRDGLSLAGFSWVDRSGTVEAIDAYLASCKMDEIVAGSSSLLLSLESGVMENEGFIPDWLQIQSLVTLT